MNENFFLRPSAIDDFSNRKLVMVEPRIYNKIFTMHDKVLSSIDDQINGILHNDRPDDEKAKLYSSALNRYHNIDKTTKIEESSKKDRVHIPDDVLSSTSNSLKPKAERLIKMIEKDGRVDFNDTAELVVNGRTISGSNASDLFNALLKKTKRSPVGFSNFTAALKDLNIPQDIMGKASIAVNTKSKVYKTKQSKKPDLSVPMKRTRLGTRIKWENY